MYLFSYNFRNLYFCFYTQYVPFACFTIQMSNAQEDSGIKTIDMNNSPPVPEFYTVDGISLRCFFSSFVLEISVLLIYPILLLFSLLRRVYVFLFFKRVSLINIFFNRPNDFGIAFGMAYTFS